MSGEWAPGALLTIDPAALPFGYTAEEAVRVLPDWLRTAATASDECDRKKYREPCGIGEIVRAIADQIEAQTKPPKPTEPTGLGAVIEDTRGVRFVRTESALGIRNPWSSALHELTLDEIESLAYDEIDVVRVLSEGVTPC